MASQQITKLEKKIANLYATREKETNKYNDTVEKLTAKYNADLENLKASYQAKTKEVKDSYNEKLCPIDKDINFYTKQKVQIEKLEAQLADLDAITEERLNRKSGASDEAN